jgi:hypothetical protein
LRAQVLELVRTEPQLGGRVVEVKFLRGSCRTLVGPNTHLGSSFKQRAKQRGGDAGAGGHGSQAALREPSDVACFNLWWRVASPHPPAAAAAFASFERCMHTLNAAPHRGKLHHLPPTPPPRLGKLPAVGYLAQALRGWSEFAAVASTLASAPVVLELFDPPREPAETTHISVVLPVWNAMPWLPVAMRDLLRQTGDVALEICVADDASTDGSAEFLAALAEAMGNRGRFVPTKWIRVFCDPLYHLTNIALSRLTGIGLNGRYE